ncbi:MAG TPA: UDP-N-acetylmuramoyl-L-alanyl-D-glutamate--2,6-diaminopimelate ligase [Thermoanaerobaculia bacterium]|nr:UDP-N-acetylmuramoyl-L-alanyl-D-glutamate--2,6-diaminopimelate ligase [Thermoanaerobaculia bacterium]
MRLSELIAGLPIEAAGSAPELEIRGVTHDSRAVAPGDLFVAMAGERHDGRAFAHDAVARGAVAVLGSGGSGAALADLPVPWLATAAPRSLLGALASRAYGHPDRELILAGVTGTNGKSTVATLIAAILEVATGKPAGFIGTLGYRLSGHPFPGDRTTPEASDLFRTLRQMRDGGAAGVAMEVSSHALELGRVEGAEFDAGIFTNLTRDHLDFHGDMEGYYTAKRRLFDHLKPSGRAVVNLDDPYGRRLAMEIPGALTYGEGGEVAPEAVALGTSGTRATLATPRGELSFVSPLLGRFNLENLLAAAAGAEALGLPHAAIAAAFAAQRPIAGRMEPVDRGQPFPVFIDYAHTDAALTAALRSVRELSRGKVAVVFGCGGERDPGKRPVMGKVAGELADLPIATSDNPRREDPDAILRAVEAGLQESGNREYRVVPDRRQAIRSAVQAAEEGWAILVAGKGHEETQDLGGRKIPFSDRDEIARALEERFGTV